MKQHLTQDMIENMWEQARDGELTPEQKRQFDDALARDPALRKRWEAESQWLEMPQQYHRDAHAFAQRALAQWQPRNIARQMMLQVAVITAAAAAVALACWVVLSAPSARQSQTVKEIAVTTPPYISPQIVPDHSNDDVIGALLTQLSQQVTRDPSSLWATLSTQSPLDRFNRTVVEWSPLLPDPADMVSQKLSL